MNNNSNKYKRPEEEEQQQHTTQKKKEVMMKKAAAMKQHQFLLHGGISTGLNNRHKRRVYSSRWAHGRQGNYLSLFLESIGGS